MPQIRFRDTVSYYYHLNQKMILIKYSFINLLLKEVTKKKTARHVMKISDYINMLPIYLIPHTQKSVVMKIQNAEHEEVHS